MTKWIAALIVVFAGLGGALLVPVAEAQRGPDAPRPDAPRPPMPAPGTWQIVTHEKLVLLLNTASGETFRLREREGELHWQPIARPGAEGPRPDMPRGERPDRPPVERDGAQRLEDEVRMLREKLRNAHEDERPRIEARIKELLEKLKGADRPEPRGDRPKGEPDREREFDEAVRREVERRERERHTEALNEKIGKLERELEKTMRAADDAEGDKREKLKQHAKELERELKSLRAERDKARKRD